MVERRASGSEGGFSLIEALIALLVLSIGMLGATAMQLNSLQGAHMAYQRSIATLAAQDAQERLWAEASHSDCPSWSDTEGWYDAWRRYLPGFANRSSVSHEGDCVFEITISWDEGRVTEGHETFIYTVRLPGKSL